MGFSFDDKPTANSQGELAVATSWSHNLRRRSNGWNPLTKCRGLPYPAFRGVKAEPRGRQADPPTTKGLVDIGVTRAAMTYLRGDFHVRGIRVGLRHAEPFEAQAL